MKCERLLDIDEEGKVWALAKISGSQPAEHQIVRFQINGTGCDIVARRLEDQEGIEPWSAVLSTDRRQLAVLTARKPDEADTIEVWDLTTGKLRTRLPGHPSHIRRLAFSSDGTELAFVPNGGNPLRMWKLRPSSP